MIGALAAEEALSNLDTSGGLVVQQTNAVVSGLYIQLILALRMKYDLVDLRSFYLLVLKQEVIDNLHTSIGYNNPPYVDPTPTITHKQSSLIIKNDGVRMTFLHHVFVLDPFLVWVSFFCLKLSVELFVGLDELLILRVHYESEGFVFKVILVLIHALFVTESILSLLFNADLEHEPWRRDVLNILDVDLPDADILVKAGCGNIEISFFLGRVNLTTVNETGMVDLRQIEQMIVIHVIKSLIMSRFLVLHVPDSAASISRACDQEAII